MTDTKYGGNGPAVWRGADATAPGVGHAADARQAHILLLVEAPGNRKQLREHLSRRYTVLDPPPNGLSDQAFDLAVVDGAGFRHWREALAAIKATEEPVFLPVMLVLPPQDLRNRMSSYRERVDEFILTPIDQTEFLERTAILLRARFLAIEQRDRLAYVCTHDAATGLPNRSLFEAHLRRAMQQASLTGKRIHVVAVRIPLGSVVQSLGLARREDAARIIAPRLQRLVGNTLLLARLTPDDWAFFTPPGMALDEVLSLCRGIGQLRNEPLELAGEAVRVKPYMGVAACPDDANRAAPAVSAAFSALSRADKGGEPVFYSRSMQDQALHYLRTETALYEAIATNQFELWLQPQIRLTDDRPCAVEALVRWRLESGELVPPAGFLPIAEASGFIRNIDRWVREEACRILGRWHRDGLEHLRMAVNVTVDDVAEPDFVEHLVKLLEAQSLDPSALEIELTETQLCGADAEVLDRLHALRRLGIGVAVDDFGMGYSALSYLQRLPVNVLKVDKSFIDKVPGDRLAEGLVEAIVGLGRHFDLELIAEGVETPAQLEYLRGLGVDVVQGFHFARPMPEAEARAWMAR